MEIRTVPATTLKAKPADETKLGFGKIFTDHMFEMDYSVEKGWHDPRVTPFHNFELSPAAMVLHYSQTIFEGLKMYRTPDGFQLFRPRDNFRRMNVSAERLAIPAFDVEAAMAGLLKLLEMDREWTPSAARYFPLHPADDHRHRPLRGRAQRLHLQVLHHPVAGGRLLRQRA